jgi:porphobilinogen synthase
MSGLAGRGAMDGGIETEPQTEPHAPVQTPAAPARRPGPAFPAVRPRRLRAGAAMRDLVRETEWSPRRLIQPLFVVPGQGVRQEIAAMPGQHHLSPDRAAAEAAALHAAGVGAVLLFGQPEEGTKDPLGREAWSPDGAVQRAVAEIKAAVPELLVMTDVCLCAYTDHGHCGVPGARDVDNDATLPLLARTALSHARAGADVVAPSDMMDGRVGAIREALDAEGFTHVAIMAYSAKYASAFYGPFREAENSTPAFGDRRGYQMDPGNVREALREVALDVGEGADMVMVKPALPYLDVIRAVRERFDLPVLAYNVSGEYAMVKAAAERGWVDERAVVEEILTAIRRAGADGVITYWAREVALWRA